jgi:hypothetical protein
MMPELIRVRASSRATLRPLSQDLGYQGTDGRTIGCYWTIPSNTYALVFIHANYSASDASTIESAYASSTGLGNGVDPLNQAGMPSANTLFRNVTWDGQLSVAISPAPRNKRIPSLVYSDAMPLVTKTDCEGESKLLFVRDFSYGNHSADSYDANTKSLASSAKYGFGGGWVNTNTANAAGRFISKDHFEGATGSGHSPLGYLVPHAIQCIIDSYCITILQTGDSINSGVSSDDGLLNPAIVASSVLSKETGIRTSVINEAISGDQSSNYIERARLALGMRPSVALIQCYSRNDEDPFGDTVETGLAAYRRSIQFSAECIDAGVVPILQTAAPLVGDRRSSTYESNRQSINELVRGSGFLYVDYDAILGTGSVPNAYKAEFSSDQIHPNASAFEVLGQATATVIKKILRVDG